MSAQDIGPAACRSGRRNGIAGVPEFSKCDPGRTCIRVAAATAILPAL
ncbi:hypothetical protein [Azospirillum palustre]